MVDIELDASVSDITDPDMQKFLHEGIPCNSKDADELQNALKVSSEVDMTLAYSSEKLANLENLSLHVLARENGVGTIDTDDDAVSAELIENSFTCDLLTAIINLELRELENLMSDLQDLVVDCLRRLTSCGQSEELLIELLRKLHDSEELIKQTQERILEMKIRLTKLQISSFSFKPNRWKSDIVGVKENSKLSSTDWKQQPQTAEQRHVLRMLERSLLGELELEKKVTELEENEEDLKSKMILVEQVAVRMEVAAEGAWERFMEADNTAEVLMGISKDLLGKLQILDLKLGDSIKREEEIKSKLQECINQLNKKELSIQSLNSKVAVLVADNSEILNLRNKVHVLEAELNETKSKLKRANSSNESTHQQLREMEAKIQSLKESLYASESRAMLADEKFMHLTDSNLELTEELDFLKGSNDTNSKRVSVLENQLQEQDIQLQHARASSEASQEQQNMLYSAIWDMETLIDELKQKVAEGKSTTESKESQCIELSEIISKLNKELDFMRSRMEVMETSLSQSTVEKKARAEDISTKTNFIMDIVKQIAMEREFIQKQLISLKTENKILRANRRDDRKHFRITEKSCNDKEFLLSEIHLVDSKSPKISTLEVTETSTVEPEMNADASTSSMNKSEIQSTDTANDTTDMVQSLGTQNSRKTYVFMTILCVLLSILAAQLLPFPSSEAF